MTERNDRNSGYTRKRIVRLTSFAVVGGLAGFAVSYLFGVMGST